MEISDFLFKDSRSPSQKESNTEIKQNGKSGDVFHVRQGSVTLGGGEVSDSTIQTHLPSALLAPQGGTLAGTLGLQEIS